MVIPKAALHGGGEPPSSPPFTIRYGRIKGGDLAGRTVGGKGFGVRSVEEPLANHPHRNNRNYDLFFNTLEQDILKNGFRNPILTWGFEDGIFVLYGTTRARFAHKHGLEVPAFIIDFTPLKHDQYKEVKSEEEALSYFTDPPYIFKWNPPKYFNFVNERYALDPMERKRINKPQGRLLPGEVFEI